MNCASGDRSAMSSLFIIRCSVFGVQIWGLTATATATATILISCFYTLASWFLALDSWFLNL